MPSVTRISSLNVTHIKVSTWAACTRNSAPAATERDHFKQGPFRYNLVPGMQVVASIQIGTRTVLEYIIDPVRYALGNAAQER